MAWPGLILSGFVWPDPACGLSNYGLSDAWPDLVRSGQTWSNLVRNDPARDLSDTWPVQLLAGGLSSHGLIRFRPVLYAAWLDTACLAWLGLVWPDSVLSDA